MAVRNFWIAAEVDGRKTELTGGPGRKDGGFHLTVYMRDKGQSIKALQVSGIAEGEQLVLTAISNKSVASRDVLQVKTER